MPAADELRLSLPQRALRWGAAGGIAAILTALFLRSPESLLPVTCTFRDLTGLSCLTCGMTRSLHALTHGDILGSVKFHLMGPLLFALAILFGGLWGAEATLGRTLRIPLIHERKRVIAGAIAVVWIGYWILRIIGELTRAGMG